MSDQDEIMQFIQEELGNKGAIQRIHGTYERAATQYFKFLGTILGGLGVVLAAWLQRIFEQPRGVLFNELLIWLAIALAFVAVGLLVLAITAYLDQRSANEFAGAIRANSQRRAYFVRVKKLRNEVPPSDERWAREFQMWWESEPLDDVVSKHEARAMRIDRCSRALGIGALCCLGAAFVCIATGVCSTVRYESRHAVPVRASATKTKLSQGLTSGSRSE